MQQYKHIVLSLLTSFLTVSLAVAQPWEEHGRLQVSDNGHFLEHTDGTGFFWLGCTAWMLPRLAPADVDRYLQDRADKGFTVIQFVVTNMRRPNYRGDHPFQGDERPWERVAFHEPYWEHIRLHYPPGRSTGPVPRYFCLVGHRGRRSG